MVMMKDVESIYQRHDECVKGWRYIYIAFVGTLSSGLSMVLILIIKQIDGLIRRRRRRCFLTQTKLCSLSGRLPMRHLLNILIAQIFVWRIAGVCNPRMLEHLFRGQPSFGVLHQQLANEILGVLGDIVPKRRGKRILSFLDQMVQVLHVIAGIEEWREAAQQRIDNDAQRPHIGRGVVFQRRQHFGSGIVRGTARRLTPTIAAIAGQSKVDDFDLGVLRLGQIHEIVRLQVAMHVSHRVHVAHSRRHLLYHVDRRLLAELFVLHHPLKHVAAVAEFHHHIDALLSVTPIA
mmetsp:Transcript_30883/g.49547  ORF Transcript_30883/g.49547 Transcript_30883/m.49547 type:complete len:291 (-) Transcript_30883:345-1217(-)